MASLLFDGILLSAVVVFAYRAIHAPALFTGVVVYIAFGLLLSIVWVRLGAADVAIAEAAIGAGVTGALLLDTAGRLGYRSALRQRLSAAAGRTTAVLIGGMAAVLAVATIGLADRSPSLIRLISTRVPESGADHPVTAVLLDFRGYDTFLEVTVLLVAGLAVLALSRGSRLGGRAGRPTEPLIPGAASILIPVAILVAGYLIWRGAYAPGGAFQAGAVLGAVAILYHLSRAEHRLVTRAAFRLLLGIGTIAFIAAGCVGLLLEGAFLDYPTTTGHLMILLVELAVAISVAVTLGLLFVAADAGETIGGPDE